VRGPLPKPLTQLPTPSLVFLLQITFFDGVVDPWTPKSDGGCNDKTPQNDPHSCQNFAKGVCGGVYDITEKGAIVEVRMDSDNAVLNRVGFVFRNQPTVVEWNGAVVNTQAPDHRTKIEATFAFDGHILSNIYVMGINKYFNTIDTAVFAFKLDPDKM